MLNLAHTDFTISLASLAATGTTWMRSWLVRESPWPLWLLLLAFTAAVAFVVAMYLWERGRASLTVRLMLAGLRLTAIALVILSLQEWSRHWARAVPPRLAIVLDASQSSDYRDRYESPSVAHHLLSRLRDAGLDEVNRWNLARGPLIESRGRRIGQLESDFELELYFVGESTRLVGSSQEGKILQALSAGEAQDSTSRLGDALVQIIERQAGAPLAGIVFLSDGIVTEGRDLPRAAHLAAARGIPVHTVALGASQPAPDLAVAELQASDPALLGDEVAVDARIMAIGMAGQRATVQLHVDRAATPIDSHQVMIDSNEFSRIVRLTWTPSQPGPYQLQVAAPPLDGEINIANNQRSTTVHVRDQAFGVLLVQYEPTFEFRFLQRLLDRQLRSGSDQRLIDLSSVLMLADPQYSLAEKTALPALPTGAQQFDPYDVVILGDVPVRDELLGQTGLSRAEMEIIRDFVLERGRSVVWIAGPNFDPLSVRGTPLEVLLPFELNRYRAPDDEPLDQPWKLDPTTVGLNLPPLQLAADPQENAQLLSQLPQLYWVAAIDQLKPGALVLAQATRQSHPPVTRPLVVLHNVGSGRVVFHATDETYRWRFRGNEPYFAQYWTQLVRFLARRATDDPRDEVLVHTDRSSYLAGEPVRLSARLPASVPTAVAGAVQVRLTRDPSVEQPESQDSQPTEPGAEPVDQLLALRPRSDRPQTHEIVLANLPPGQYRATLVVPEVAETVPFTTFSIEAPIAELMDLAANVEGMRQLAEITGGVHALGVEYDAIWERLPAARPVIVEPLPSRPLWNRWPLMLALALVLVTLLAVEWTVRARSAMA